MNYEVLDKKERFDEVNFLYYTTIEVCLTNITVEDDKEYYFKILEKFGVASYRRKRDFTEQSIKKTYYLCPYSPAINYLEVIQYLQFEVFINSSLMDKMTMDSETMDSETMDSKAMDLKTMTRIKTIFVEYVLKKFDTTKISTLNRSLMEHFTSNKIRMFMSCGDLVDCEDLYKALLQLAPELGFPVFMYLSKLSIYDPIIEKYSIVPADYYQGMFIKLSDRMNIIDFVEFVQSIGGKIVYDNERVIRFYIEREKIDSNFTSIIHMLDNVVDKYYNRVKAAPEEWFEKFSYYLANEKSMLELKRLFNFSLNYRDFENPMFYNLMIVAEDEYALDAAEDLAKKIYHYLARAKAANVPDQRKIKRIREGQIPGYFDNFYRFLEENKGKNFILTNFSYFDKDSDTVNLRARFDVYEFINDICMDNKDRLHIMVVTEEVAKKCLKLNSQLYHRTFGHRIYVRNYTWEEVYEVTLASLEALGYEMPELFVEELGYYIEAIYEDADLQNERFVNDLVNRIVTNYFAELHEKKILDIDCIPNYQIQSNNVDALKDISEYRGIDNVKKELDFLTTLALDNKKSVKQRYHMIFAGNPGTGKTTVAKLVSNVFYQAKLIERQKMIVLNAQDLNKPVRGLGVDILKEHIRKARGGILFIDEAYAIADFDKNNEIVPVILTACEDGDVTFIFAGYKKEMEDKFLKMNAGLSSRIYKTVEFQNYSDDTLIDIFLDMCEKEEFSITEDALESLRKRIGYERVQTDFGNVRTLEKLFQEIKMAFLMEYRDNREIPRTFTIKHVEANQPTLKVVNLDDFVGLTTIKKTFKDFEEKVNYAQYLKARGIKVPESNLHMIFTGNPGTGKTTVAKAVADYLFKIGALKSNKLTVVERKDLIAQYVGQTAPKTNAVIEKAMGGVLFIDEAYSLTPEDSYRDFGPEAIDTLIVAMEEHKDDFVVIFAGYEKEMNRFLDSNPGIQSRIGYQFHFEDYSTDELADIFEKKLTDAGFVVLKTAKDQARKVLHFYSDMPRFGNGRFVESLVSKTIVNRAKREYNEKNYNKITKADIPSIAEINKTISTGIQLYDPGKQKKKAIYETAVHELGHAVVSFIAFPERKIESISISENTSSLGRVKLGALYDNMTESQYKGEIASLLAGRNAERLFFGESTSGCSSDYKWAKNLANNMVNKFAMGEIGVTTPKSILKEADQRATEILTEYKACLEGLVDKLLKEKDISGEEFAKYMKKYMKKK